MSTSELSNDNNSWQVIQNKKKKKQNRNQGEKYIKVELHNFEIEIYNSIKIKINIEQKVKDTHIAMDEANKKLSDYDKAHHIMPGQLDKGHFALVNAANAANAASDKALAEQDASSRTISAGGHK